MKKTLLSILGTIFCLCVAAQTERTYNEQYVYAPEEAANQGNFSDPQDCVITVTDNGNGTANFVFKNFVVNFGGSDMPLGDITLDNVSVTQLEDGLTYFGQESTFEGGLLNGIPFKLGGKMNDVKFFAGIEINMSDDQIVYVVIGTDDFGTPTPDGKVYTEQLIVTINGQSAEPEEASVTVVDNGDNTIDFVLKDFTITMGSTPTNIGDISLEDVPVTEGEDGLKYFNDEGRTFTIPADKLPDDFKPYSFAFENIPYTLQGKLNDTKLYATINIDMSRMGQDIYVEVGTDDFLSQNGKVYTEQLLVTVNGEPQASQTTDVTVIDNEDGTINFELKNFVLSQEGNEIGVGNIILNNIAVTEGEDGLQHFSYDGTLAITAGDKPGVDMWIGPLLCMESEIPVVLQGKMNDDKLFVTIDINMGDMVVFVQLGTDDFPSQNSKVYTEQLLVTVNGEPQASQTTDVTVINNEDGTINFELKNFVLSQEGNEIGVGNIILNNIAVTEGEDGLQHFSYDGTLAITAGDKPGVDMWIGPLLCMESEIPVVLQGKMNDDKLFVTIDINMGDMVVFVQLGTDDFPAVSVTGDVNNDGVVDGGDAQQILNVMSVDGYDSACDINGDNFVDGGDYQQVLNIMSAQ